MWQCIDCGKMFQLPYTEHICPYCGSGDIILFDEQDSLDENDYSNLSAWNLELSFEDLDSHEYDLLDADPLPDENGNIAPCYYTDMLERFTHTFVDSCFMPI